MLSLALFVTHNIFFNKQQIEKFIKKDHIKIIGVTVPVWVNAKNSKTTESSQEFFCKYEIYNNQREKDIILTKNGYKIFLEKSNWKKPSKIQYKNLSEMNEEERILYLEKRDKWWKKNPKPMDMSEFEQTKYFRTEIKKLNQVFHKIPNSSTDCHHVIEISCIENLLNSLII